MNYCSIIMTYFLHKHKIQWKPILIPLRRRNRVERLITLFRFIPNGTETAKIKLILFTTTLYTKIFTEAFYLLEIEN